MVLTAQHVKGTAENSSCTLPRAAPAPAPYPTCGLGAGRQGSLPSSSATEGVPGSWGFWEGPMIARHCLNDDHLWPGAWGGEGATCV